MASDLKGRLQQLGAESSSRGLAESKSEQRGTVLLGQEKEWKQRVYLRLLKVMDLSLIESLEARQARPQIREYCQDIITRETIPLTLEARQRLIEEVKDEILGLGPMEPLLHDATSATSWSTARSAFTWSASASSS